MNKVNLMQYCKAGHGGCAAKIEPAKLREYLQSILFPANLAVPSPFLSNWDDVGVFEISETQYVVLSVDMITPVVNDAVAFGEIATAHALSDIYSKGLLLRP